MAAALLAGVSCETVDPGPNFQLPTIQFNANYFYCVVEPEVIMGGITGTKCGDNGSHGCHYSNKVPEMALTPLITPVNCSAGIPTDMTQVADGTPASSNLSAVSIQMNAVYTTAPIYLWPSQVIISHPVQVFHVPPATLNANDQKIITIIKTWAMQ
jgi:hypothetical protein